MQNRSIKSDSLFLIVHRVGMSTSLCHVCNLPPSCIAMATCRGVVTNRMMSSQLLPMTARCLPAGVRKPITISMGLTRTSPILHRGSNSAAKIAQHRGGRGSREVRCHASILESLAPVALFFTPGLLALVYAYFKGKGNLQDGLSR